MRAARRPFTVALPAVALAVVLAGCSGTGPTAPASSASSAAPTQSAAAGSGSGITAEPRSSALQVQARDVRLVRNGTDELALQFEFANNTDRPISPDTLGIDQIERIMMLVDLPRSTTYEMLDSGGLDGRLSESNGDDVPPGGVATVTAVFPAPPEDATGLLVLIDGMLPVQAPVQPAGSPALVDDPVLRASGPGEPRVGTVLCPADGPSDSGGTKKTVIRLPSDVLFAFGSAELTPAAQQAIAAVDDEIGSGGTGTVTVEGHTDAIGGDGDNQALSERRAAAVRTALEAVLGSGYQYTAVGFGETQPVAPNTRPDGSDDPDGRALNRRVEVRTGSVEQVPATLEPLPVTRDLADAGLRAEVTGLERRSGYLMVLLTVTNPTGQAIELGPGSGLTPNQGDPLGLTLADRTDQLRQQPCRMSVGRSGAGFGYLANPSTEYTLDGSNSIPAGARVTFYAFFAPPAAGIASVDVEIGGFGETVPTPVPS
jgi:outer membrane protein OmpA-like peptidoglycan-associated protein